MKLLRPLLVLFLFIPFANVKAQQAIPGKVEVIGLISKKWIPVQMAGGGRKMDLPPSDDYMLFKSNLTYEHKQEEHLEKGTWAYNESARKITFSPSGNIYTLKELSASKLVLEFLMEGQKVSLIFKPAQ